MSNIIKLEICIGQKKESLIKKRIKGLCYSFTIICQLSDFLKRHNYVKLLRILSFKSLLLLIMLVYVQFNYDIRESHTSKITSNPKFDINIKNIIPLNLQTFYFLFLLFECASQWCYPILLQAPSVPKDQSGY